MRKKVSGLRKRMIAYNRAHHPEDNYPKREYNEAELETAAPEDYKKLLELAKHSDEGREALARYRKFWGLPLPTEIKVVSIPGPEDEVKFLVGMGRAGKGGKIILPGGKKTSAKGARIAAASADGKQIVLLSGKESRDEKRNLNFLGHVEETHYVPTADMEDAGTHKAGKYWVHRHDDEGGKFPPVYQDQAGNYWYGPGTYSVTDWIRR